MARSTFEDFSGSILGLIVIALLLLLALIVTPLFLIGVVVYVVFRLYRESPIRLERLAREETTGESRLGFELV